VSIVQVLKGRDKYDGIQQKIVAGLRFFSDCNKCFSGFLLAANEFLNG
jgi:hypothetical protein